jgi:galactonate dehydratase
MKINGCKVYPIDLRRKLSNHIGPREFIFIKLTTDEGIVGYGEAFGAPFRLENVARLTEEVVNDVMLGMSPYDTELAWRKVYGRYYNGRPDVTVMAIMSAIDMACWDIIGKVTKQPVYNLLGGKYNSKIRTYTYVYGNQNDLVKWAETIKEYMEMGFTAVKFDPIPVNINPRMLSLYELRKVDNILKVSREVAGDKCDILVGTHGQFTTSEAVRLAKVMEPYNPLWFEEPVPPDNIEEMAIVARSTSIPIASGERLTTKYEFYQLISKNAIGIAQLDMGRVGGVLEAKKIAGIAEANYVVIAPHVWAGPIMGLASINLDVCSPNFLIQESILDWRGFYNDSLKEPVKWENGYIIPSEKPGLGSDLNEYYVEKIVES